MKKSPKAEYSGLWTPRVILENNNLTYADKTLLAYIKAMSKGDGCFASSESLAARFGVSVGTIKNRLTKLKKEGYIKTVKSDGRRRWLKLVSDCENERINTVQEVMENMTPEVMENMTPEVMENMTPEVMENMTSHHIMENKEEILSCSGGSSQPKTTTNPSSSKDKKPKTGIHVIWEGQVFSPDDLSDEAIDRIEDQARRSGLHEDRLPDFLKSIVDNNNHFIIKNKGPIDGLKDLIQIHLKSQYACPG